MYKSNSCEVADYFVIKDQLEKKKTSLLKQGHDCVHQLFEH